MAIYSNLSKLGRVKLPSGREYALIDVDGRAMLAPNFSAEASYSEGDHVIYGDNLYRFKVDHSAGEWNAAHADQITIDTEIKRLEGIMSGGIHYRGKTVTPLYEGATTNPISIGGVSYTADSGDLVIFDLGLANAAAYATNTAYNVGTYVIHESITYLITDAISAIENTSGNEISSKVTSVGVNPIRTYAVATAYSANTYIKNAGIVYISNDAISAADNENFAAIEEKLGVVKSDPEFLFDGSKWNILGSISDGLGDLAFKDSASGTYVKPSGTGTVTIKNYSATPKYLERTTVIGVKSTTESATLVSGGTTKNQWKADTTNPTVVYGTADVGSAVVYGTANPGTAKTGIAEVGSQKTFTTAWSNQNLTGAVTASVSGDCLQIGAANTDTVYGVKDATGVSITPAVLSETTLTPAKAADSTRTISNLVADGTLKGSYTLANKALAVKADNATTLATGGTVDNPDGAAVLPSLSSGTETANVTVDTESDTVTVR